MSFLKYRIFTNCRALLQTHKALMCTQQSCHFHFITCLCCTRCSGYVPHAVTQTAAGHFESTFCSCVIFPWQLSPQDFLIMFLHHVATISLITFSYVNNMARVGTLVMCLHDAADVLIEVRTGERMKCCGWTDGQMEAKMMGCVGGVFGVCMLSYLYLNLTAVCIL